MAICESNVKAKVSTFRDVMYGYTMTCKKLYQNVTPNRNDFETEEEYKAAEEKWHNEKEAVVAAFEKGARELEETKEKLEKVEFELEIAKETLGTSRSL